MKGISSLFGRSPFVLVVEHGQKVDECVSRLSELLAVFFEDGDQAKIAQMAQEVSDLETEADAIRNKIHRTLSGKILMAVSRGELFDLVEQQDSMADRSEEIAAGLNFRKLTLPEELSAEVRRFVEIVLQNCTIAAGVISKLELLMESSFAKMDALTVLKLIDELRERDDSTRDAFLAATGKIYAAEDTFSHAELMLWIRILESLENLSSAADCTVNGLRIIIENQKN